MFTKMIPLFLIAGLAHAGPKVTCKVANLSDAEACMEKLAEASPKAEESNDGLASYRTKALRKLLKSMDYPERELKKLDQADYVGAMVFHDDEHHIFYYTIKKGAKVTPVEYYDLNIADLPYEEFKRGIPDPLEFFLGVSSAKSIDAYDDVVRALKESEERRRER